MSKIICIRNQSHGSDLFTKCEPRRNPNPNLNNLVIGFFHQSYAFWRIGLNVHPLLLLGFWKVGLLRGRKNIIYWCMPLLLPCFSPLFTTYVLSSFSKFSLSQSFAIVLPWVLPPFPSMATAPLYSGLIPQDFSLYPYGLWAQCMEGSMLGWVDRGEEKVIESPPSFMA